MPSYRKDRPGPSSFRRERPQEERPGSQEEHGFRRPSFLRREASSSEFASRPVGPAERKELWEVLVPKSEQEDPHFDYDKVFEVLRPRRAGGPSAAPPPPPPPREGPSRGEPTRPARAPGQPPVVDAGLFFDLDRIWNAVATLKHDPRFKPGNPVAVVRTAPQADVSRFFQIQPADVAPFLEELAYSINTEKPRDLPGRFLFQQGKDGFVWLAYVE